MDTYGLQAGELEELVTAQSKKLEPEKKENQ